MEKPINKSISVIIPAYNEEDNINKIVKLSEKIFSSLFSKFEIIVVNDGSADQTGTLANNLSKTVKSLRVCHHQKNQGMGQAVQTGISQARNDLIFVTCADLQFDLHEFDKFIPFIDQADIVIGCRIDRGYKWYRKLVTNVYLFLIRLMFGLKVKDPTWVKLFKRKIFDDISITSQGFFWEVEVLVRAKKKGYSIKQVDVHSHQRIGGQASGSNPFKILEALLTMIKFWWKLKFEK